MKFNQKILVVAIAAALPWVGAHAQSNADLLRQIEALKAQLEALTAKVEAVSRQSGAVNPQEFNRLVQKVDLAEESSIASGFRGLKFKGVIEATYLNDRNSVATGFNMALGNGGYGAAFFEVSKESEDSVGWTLRLMPLSETANAATGFLNTVHEASISVPIGDGGTKLIAGLVPDFSGYEYSAGNQNPLVTNNLMYANAASNYTGVGMSYVINKSWTAKWMVAQVDGIASRKAPGFVYRADYSASEYSGVGFSGVHFRTNATAAGGNADLMEIDAYHTRGDLTLQGQFSVGRLIAGGLDGSGGDAKWWGLSGLAGYKLTPRLQALVRADYINNRKNGGGLYFHPFGAAGAELDSTGVALDPSKGANLYALSAGFNYSVNPTTQWKTELRFDRATGYNFIDSNGVGRKGNTTIGTSVVVSF